MQSRHSSWASLNYPKAGQSTVALQVLPQDHFFEGIGISDTATAGECSPLSTERQHSQQQICPPFKGTIFDELRQTTIHRIEQLLNHYL